MQMKNLNTLITVIELSNGRTLDYRNSFATDRTEINVHLDIIKVSHFPPNFMKL